MHPEAGAHASSTLARRLIPPGGTSLRSRTPSHDSTAIRLCACGCGQQTKPYKRHSPSRGQFKGQPAKYVKGHTGGKVTSFDTVTDPETGCITYVTPHALPYRSLRPEPYSDVMQAHRATWIRAHGPIGEGYVVHHQCENKGCINLDHLELMEWGEHSRHHTRKACMTKAHESDSA